MAVSKEQFAEGTIWKVLERLSSRGISLVISIVLARILSPDDYGLIALTTVFTNLSEILIDAGFSTALIRKKQVDDSDYACVFSISLLISLLLYSVLFALAPFISSFYERRELTAVLRVMSLVLLIQALASTRNAYVNRNMQFKLLMKCNTFASIFSGVSGIVLAYMGMGVWALVLQRLLQQGVVTLLLFTKIKWKPKLKFNKNNFKDLFGFSVGVIGASLINFAENCVNSLVVGKHYSVADLGYMDKANILPEQLSLNTFGAMTNVLLPTISSYQLDKNRIKMVVRKVVRYTAFVLFPMMLGMLIVTNEAIIVLFTDKWLSSAPLMRCICIYYIATPLMLIDVQVFFGLGHSRTRLKTELFRISFIVTGMLLCCFAFDLDIKYLALANAISACLGTAVTHIEVKKLIDYTLKERLVDTYKPLVSSLIMCAAVKIIKTVLLKVSLSVIALLIIEVVFGIGVYLFLSFILRVDTLYEMFGIIKNKLSRSGE